MIRTLLLGQTPITPCDQREFSRIISAAVVSDRFKKALLTNPVQAISTGFSGETFELRKEQTARLATIHAASLAEFAAQLA